MSVLLLACTFQFMGARRPPGQQDEYAAYAYSRRNEQVKKRRTEVLAVGIIGDDDGTNAEDEHGEAEETCSEQCRAPLLSRF